MKYINNQDIMDPRINFAIEEHILFNLDPDETYLLFYSMDPSIIVGKNQNTIEQINVDFVEKNHVYVVRRLSGGGAVYNDRGDLSFSFVTKLDKNSFHNYAKFTDPVVQALRELGVEAKLSGRNDILVEGKKISGNAQFTTKGRMISHGTLLFDVDLDDVTAALHVSKEKIESKGVQSIRNRVANIRDYLKHDMTIAEFKSTLLQSIFAAEDVLPEYRLTDDDWASIHNIAERRYKNWDWNYGKSPRFNVQRRQKFDGGIVDVRLNVVKGIIESVAIYGDFFGMGDVHEVEAELVGTRYDKASLRNLFNHIDVAHYFGNISENDLISLIY